MPESTVSCSSCVCQCGGILYPLGSIRRSTKGPSLAGVAVQHGDLRTRGQRRRRRPPLQVLGIHVRGAGRFAGRRGVHGDRPERQQRQREYAFHRILPEGGRLAVVRTVHGAPWVGADRRGAGLRAAASMQRRDDRAATNVHARDRAPPCQNENSLRKEPP